MISSPSFFNTTPSFSPDGKKLAFCSARQDTNGDGKIDATDRAGLYVADLSNSAVVEIASNAHHNASPIWAPDGRSLLYFSSRPLGAQQAAEEDISVRHLFLHDFETHEDYLLIPASLNPRYPTYTPDGRQIVVCTVDMIGGPSGLSIVDVTSQVRRTLTSHAWEHTYPQVSPDGKGLLYVSWRNARSSTSPALLDTNPSIYLMHLDSGKETELVGDRYSNAFPRFSPDGNFIVYLSRRRDTNGDGRIDQLDNFGIYTQRLSDRKETCVVSDDHYNKFPAWSSDSRSILFMAHWPELESRSAWRVEDYFEFKGIYRVPASGGKPRRVVSDKFFGSRFCEVSGQGHLVAYVSWRPKTNRGLYIADYSQLPSLDQLRSFIQNNLS
jgi:Tol biopolymer transport system component